MSTSISISCSVKFVFVLQACHDFIQQSVLLRVAYEGGFIFLLFSCNYLILNCPDARVYQWRKVMARDLQQMLSAKGSSPTGSADKLQHQKICKVNVQT